MKKLFRISFYFCIGLLLQVYVVQGQSYFKVFEEPEKYFNQKVERFANGDVLIGDSSLESQRTGTNGKVFMSRRDNCGHLLWAYSYNLEEGYLELKDFKINQAEEIFAYGSFFRGLRELIFLIKIDGQSGSSKGFSLYDPGSVDHTSYSLSLKSGQVMLYGLLLDFNTQKEGFVALFNEALQFQWAKKFAPFDAPGSAIICEDGGFLCRSRDFLIKFDNAGALKWATVLDVAPNIHTIGGPFEVSGGFILEAHQNGFNFFYKVNNSGQIIWETAQFPSSEEAAALSLLGNGNVLCTYARPIDEGNQLCQLILNQEGGIVDQKQLILEQTMNTGTIYQSVDANNTITITGNTDPFSIVDVEIRDFLLQFSLDSPSGDCLHWESFVERFPNQTDLRFSYYDFEPISFDMRLEQTLKTDTTSFAQALQELCDITPPNFLQKDTTLPCGEDWLAFLPGPDFVWVDNSRENPRLVSQAGKFKARKLSCINPIVVDYSLTKPNCECQVYLPNAFSPNSDGINDELTFSSDCPLEKIEITVYNRWGELVFQNKTLGKYWDASSQPRSLPAGVYIAVVSYQWMDSDGMLQEGYLAQDVTLLR